MQRNVMLLVLAVLTAAPVVGMPDRADAEISDKHRKELKGYVDTHLGGGGPEVKAAALLAWGRFADDESLEKIAEYKTSDDERVRLAAKLSLYLAGADDAKQAAVKALRSVSGLYGILGQTVTVLPDDREVELLEAVLEHDKTDASTKKAIFRYLADQSGPLFELLGPRLQSSDAKVRKAAVTAVRASANPGTLHYAGLMVDSDEEAVRRDGLDLLVSMSRIPGRRTKAATKLRDVVDHDSADLAQRAAIRLLELHDKSGVDRLVTILKEAEEAKRKKEVASALLEHRVSPSTDKIKPLWKAAEDEELKQTLLELTVASGDSETFKKVVEMYGTTKFDKRIRAVKALGHSNKDRAADLVGKALFEGSSEMRIAAATSLHQMANPKTMGALKRAMRQERNRKVKVRVVRALGAIGNEEALQTLRFSTTAKDPKVKMAIVDAIKDSGKKKGIQTLQMFFNARSVKLQWKTFVAAMHIAPEKAMGRISMIFRNPPDDFVADLEGLELPTLKRLYARLLRLENGRVRATVVRSAERIGEPMFELFREAIQDDEVAASTRLALLSTLAEHKRESDRVYMQKLVRSGGNADLVKRAAWTLAEYGTDSLEATFRGWLIKDDALLKMIATYGIAGIVD